MRVRLRTLVHWLALGLVACNAPGRSTRSDSAPSATPERPANTASATTAPATTAPSTTSADPGPSSAPVAPPPVTAVQRLARSSNAFGFDLYGRLRAGSDNLAVSPASITFALGMTWGGARGETAEEMRRVLNLAGAPDEVMKTSGQLARSLVDPRRPVTFRIANQLFGEQTCAFEKPYLDRMQAAYGAPLERLDFAHAPEAARQHVNAWVAGKTERRISELVPPRGIEADTRLVLVNALYFLGGWATPFTAEATHTAPFFVTKTERRDVPTMHNTLSLRFGRRDGVSVVELPYEGGNMAMVLVVPDAVDGLASVEAKLDASRLAALVQGLKPERVTIALPKFEIAPPASLALSAPLIALGMPTAFSSKADFSGISRTPLFIGEVFHKAFVKVDEKGTEAAAATAVVMRPKGAARPEPTTHLDVDRPFLFFLQDTASGLVLFMGRVTDPTNS